YQSRPYRLIRAVVAWCVRRRRTVVALTLGALAASMASFALIPKQFFPTSNRPEILVDMWLPEGTSFEETERQAKRLEERLVGDPDLASITTFIGEGAPRLYLRSTSNSGTRTWPSYSWSRAQWTRESMRLAMYARS